MDTDKKTAYSEFPNFIYTYLHIWIKFCTILSLVGSWTHHTVKILNSSNIKISQVTLF